ncbi:hypothetical protein BCR44DRAFT_116633 [Catenaria anguillulae PL171]|uniref:Stress-response A/B barrel domain-containing protein n=1 Tax=Catenaria anguillulae PL171 TaxID=765915 RepID=A0A1Y2HKY0_9FUNG|nr:hypothetical protein BCR44DRAFT_116633 [Catenaria anguillulae PL171]
MTIIHIVLFKFKADASAEAIESARKELLNLQSLLPNHISKISFGKSFTDRHKGFEYVLTVEMPSRQALAEYSPHPEHQRVVKSHIMPILDDIMAVDYEV